MKETQQWVKKVYPLTHLVPRLFLKSLYHLHSVLSTVLISNTSLASSKRLNNIWTLTSTTTETLLDQSNEKVVLTELATGIELGADIPHVLDRSSVTTNRLIKFRG